MSFVTPEQQKIIEEKRQTALRKREERNGFSNLNLFNVTVISQGRTEENIQNKNFYAGRERKWWRKKFRYRFKSNKKEFGYSGAEYASWEASLSLISEDRFVVDMPNYYKSLEVFESIHEKLLGEFFKLQCLL